MSVENYLPLASAISALAASGLWFCACFVKVRAHEVSKDSAGLSPMQIIRKTNSEDIDVLETSKKQVTWNRWAAFMTSVAAFLQSASVIW